MKINIETEQLKNSLNKILTVIDKRNSRPILTNCLVKVEKNRIELILQVYLFFLKTLE